MFNMKDYRSVHKALGLGFLLLLTSCGGEAVACDDREPVCAVTPLRCEACEPIIATYESECQALDDGATNIQPGACPFY